MKQESRRRVDFGARLTAPELAELAGDDPGLTLIGALRRTERDALVVYLERRPTWPHPSIVLQVARRDDPHDAPVWLRTTRSDVRKYEVRGVARLLEEAADLLDAER